MLGPTAKEKTKARVDPTRKTPTPVEEDGSRFRATVIRMLKKRKNSTSPYVKIWGIEYQI